MIFAAGFGTRMGALTADCPKPLLRVGGQSLLDRALALADHAGMAPLAVNSHYLAPQIAAHLATRPEVAISEEADEILETGGGLRRALPLLGGADTVMTLNPDGVFTGGNPLALLAGAWDPARMDALLLVMPGNRVRGRGPGSDFLLDGAGRISRAKGAEGHLYLGAQIVKTGGLHAVEERAFSLNRLWDRMIAEGRAFGLIWPGEWCDVGSPEGLAAAEVMLAEART